MTISAMTRRRAGGAAAIGLTVVGAGGAMAGQAAAADLPPGFIGLETQPSHFGTMKPQGYDKQIICIDAGKWYPSRKTPATTVTNQPQTAYLMSKYSQTTDKITAAALTYLVKLKMDSQQSVVAKSYATIPAANKAAFDAKVAELRAEAANYAGPYNLNAVKLSAATTKVGGTVTYQNANPKSAAGYVSQQGTVTLTISGPGVFATNGQKTLSVKTVKGQPMNYDVKATGAGTVTVNETVSGLPSGSIYVHSPQREGYQRMAEYVNGGVAPTITTSKSFAVTAAPVPPTKAAPTITTKTSNAEAKVGGKVSDTVMGSGFPAGAKVTGKSVLYAQNADGTQGAKVGEGTYTATADKDGKFTAKTTTVTVPNAGKYTWVESHAAGSVGNTQWDAATSKWGDVDETTIVTPPSPNTTPVTPMITTKTSNSTVAPRAKIFDTVKGSGFPAGATVEGTSVLYKVGASGVPADGSVPDDATQVGVATYTATADDKGEFEAKTSELEVPSAGTYVWVESHQGGEHDNKTWEASESPFGDTAETTNVKEEIKVYTPKITTKMNVVGEKKLSDTIVITGAPANTELSGTDTLYGPLEKMPAESDAAPADAKIVKTIKWKGTTDAQGNLTIQTDEVDVPSTGVYVWQEKLNGGESGNAKWETTTGKYGQVVESTEITPKTVQPVVTTQTSVATVNGKTDLYDTIKVTGGVPGSTVTGKDVLYGPFQTKPAEGEIPSNAKVVGTVSWKAVLDKDGNATVKSPSITIDKPGYYVWLESLDAGKHGDSTWKASTDKFGRPSETTYFESPKTPTTPVTPPATPVTPPPAPVTPPVVGPKVQTDNVASSNAASLAGLALGAAALTGGIVVMRRRSNGNA